MDVAQVGADHSDEELFDVSALQAAGFGSAARERDVVRLDVAVETQQLDELFERVVQRALLSVSPADRIAYLSAVQGKLDDVSKRLQVMLQKKREENSSPGASVVE